MFEQLAKHFDSFYSWMYQDYEKWLALPIIVLLLALGTIGYAYVTTGDFVPKGIEFTGGSEIKIAVSPDVTQQQILTAFQQDFPDANVRTLASEGGNKWLLVETASNLQNRQQNGAELGSGNNTGTGAEFNQQEAEDKVTRILDASGISYSQISIRTIGSAVSGSFLFEAQIATVVAFLIMSTVIFVAFRSIVPSLAVILAAFTDIAVAIAGMNLLGIDLTLGSLAALLMLIGYSVDTDIVLSTRVLKQRKRALKERVKDSITTGLTMTGGAIAAFVVLLLVSTSPTLDQIAAVMLIGLIADIPITWTGNAIILKMHVEGKI